MTFILGETHILHKQMELFRQEKAMEEAAGYGNTGIAPRYETASDFLG